MPHSKLPKSPFYSFLILGLNPVYMLELNFLNSLICSYASGLLDICVNEQLNRMNLIKGQMSVS